MATDMFLVAEDLKVITVDNKTYIGILSESDDGNSIEHAIEVDVDNDVEVWQCIRPWFTHYNRNNLVTLTLPEAQGYSHTDFTEQEKKILVRAEADMKEAKLRGMALWENKVFNEMK